MMSRFSAVVHQEGDDRFVVELTGYISWDTYADFAAVLNQTINRGCKYLKLDLKNIVTIHSCAFGPIIETMATLEARGGNIGFRNVGAASRRVFDILEKMNIKPS